MKEQILANLPEDFPWRSHIHWFDSIESTNTHAKALAKAGAPHGTVLIADHQTGGRGRRGRSFHSPAGVGVYMSVLLRPECPPARLMHLTCAAAVAACDAVESAAGIRPGIKWTNDLVWGQKKLAGILTELSLTPEGTVEYAIIGIGVNCCQRPEDFPEELRSIAASLSAVTGREIDRNQVSAALILQLEKMARTLTCKEATLARYKKDCITLGKYVSLVRGKEVSHGTAVDIDGEGALIVRRDDGSMETVNSGEVSVRGMYGYV